MLESLHSKQYLVNCNQLKIENAINNRIWTSIVLILIVILLLMNCGFQNFIAKDCINSQIELVNPKYSDGLGKEPLTVGSSVEKKTVITTESKERECGNKEELLSYVREQMLARVNEFSVRYTNSAYEDVLTVNSFKGLMDEIFAFDDPSTLTDCDYLRVSWTKADLKVIAYEDYAIYKFSFLYLTTKEEEEEIDGRIKEILSLLNDDQLTDYKKVKAVNDYIVKSISFDTSNNNKSVYQAVVNGSTNCRGYSLLTYRLLNELSVPTRIITGEGNGKPHAWNIVKIDSMWYNLDITWNDTTCSDSFFLKNEKDFYLHKREEMFNTKAFYTSYPIAIKSFKM